MFVSVIHSRASVFPFFIGFFVSCLLKFHIINHDILVRIRIITILLDNYFCHQCLIVQSNHHELSRRVSNKIIKVKWMSLRHYLVRNKIIIDRKFKLLVLFKQQRFSIKLSHKPSQEFLRYEMNLNKWLNKWMIWIDE